MRLTIRDHNNSQAKIITSEFKIKELLISNLECQEETTTLRVAQHETVIKLNNSLILNADAALIINVTATNLTKCQLKTEDLIFQVTSTNNSMKYLQVNYSICLANNTKLSNSYLNCTAEKDLLIETIEQDAKLFNFIWYLTYF